MYTALRHEELALWERLCFYEGKNDPQPSKGSENLGFWVEKEVEDPGCRVWTTRIPSIFSGMCLAWFRDLVSLDRELGPPTPCAGLSLAFLDQLQCLVPARHSVWEVTGGGYGGQAPVPQVSLGTCVFSLLHLLFRRPHEVLTCIECILGSGVRLFILIIYFISVVYFPVQEFTALSAREDTPATPSVFMDRVRFPGFKPRDQHS